MVHILLMSAQIIIAAASSLQPNPGPPAVALGPLAAQQTIGISPKRNASAKEFLGRGQSPASLPKTRIEHVAMKTHMESTGIWRLSNNPYASCACCIAIALSASEASGVEFTAHEPWRVLALAAEVDYVAYSRRNRRD